MKIAVALSLILALVACAENRPPEVICEVDAQAFPITIDGGSKVVYQVGKMTPRGLKFHLDTTDTPNNIIVLTDSVSAVF
jgi:hypothetical protein